MLKESRVMGCNNVLAQTVDLLHHGNFPNDAGR